MASLPEFIEAGMAYFRGETVSKPTFLKLETAHGESIAKVAELEAALKTLNLALAENLEKDKANVAAVSAANEEVGKLNAEVAALKTTIATLEANFQNAAQQAQAQVRAVGASQPVATPAPAAESASTFADVVKQKVASGKTKSASIAETIKQSPALYSEWLKGDTSKL